MRSVIQSAAKHLAPARERPVKLIGMRTSLLAISGLLFLAGSGSAARAQAAATTREAVARVRLAVADSVYGTGNASLAERYYRTVLQADPSNSRAVFRLAQLAHDRPDEAVELFRRYVALESRDPWGYIALGDALARVGDVDSALAVYDGAEAIAPAERDVQVGRARVLAGAHRTDASIGAYERWLARHPADDEAWLELSAQYARAGRTRSAIDALEKAATRTRDAKRRAQAQRRLSYLRATTAPAVQMTAGGSDDSDGNLLAHVALSVDAAPADALGLQLTSSTTHVGDGVLASMIYDASLGGSWRPTSALRVEAHGGATFADSTAAGTPARAVPTGDLRLTWKDPGDAAALELRGSRMLVAASPLLVRNEVVRNEVAARADRRLLGPVGVRLLGRAAQITSTIDRNTRTQFGGGVVLSGALGELTATMQQMQFARPSSSGYFAPQSARIAEVGSYLERESESGVRLALDLGAGAQQVTQWGLPAGPWGPAYRAWGQLAYPFAPGRELHLELEAYDAKIGSEVTATSSSWKYGSVSLGMRWGF